jgi:hypothetical protein
MHRAKVVIPVITESTDNEATVVLSEDTSTQHTEGNNHDEENKETPNPKRTTSKINQTLTYLAEQ